MKAEQMDFRLGVSVCAWCKPRKGHEFPREEVLSHGICLRHFRDALAKGDLASHLRHNFEVHHFAFDRDARPADRLAARPHP